jgi:hypothetical protein
MFPNHPRTRWSADVEMLTRDGARSFFTITAAEPGDPNGTLVNISYKPDTRAWNLGDLRVNDGLDALLESATRRARDVDDDEDALVALTMRRWLPCCGAGIPACHRTR